MSDRSAFTLIIYDCPPRQHEALLEILRREGLLEDWMDPVGDKLLLAVRYTAEEMPLDSYETVPRCVIAAAPGASFECWNDPKYEYPGAISMYTPELGLFVRECDADGSPYLTAAAYRMIEWDGDDPIGQIEEILGLPWLNRFDQLKEHKYAR